MKFNEVQSNIDSYVLYKENKSFRGSALSITPKEKGNILVKIANQSNELKNNKATYHWNNINESSFFKLSSSECRRILNFIDKFKSNKIKYYISEYHNLFNDKDKFDYLEFVHSTNNQIQTFYILPIFLKSNNQERRYLNIKLFRKNKKDTDGKLKCFNFSLNEFEISELKYILFFHQKNNFNFKSGFRSVVLDKSENVLLDSYIPSMNIGDYIKFYDYNIKNYSCKLINKKIYDDTLDIIIYEVN